MDERYISLGLIGQELLSCISCPIRVKVCNNRSSLTLGDYSYSTDYDYDYGLGADYGKKYKYNQEEKMKRLAEEGAWYQGGKSGIGIGVYGKVKESRYKALKQAEPGVWYKVQEDAEEALSYFIKDSLDASNGQ